MKKVRGRKGRNKGRGGQSTLNASPITSSSISESFTLELYLSLSFEELWLITSFSFSKLGDVGSDRGDLCVFVMGVV